MTSLFIYGAGGFGRETLEIVREITTIHNKWNNFYFIDDFHNNRIINGVQVVDFMFFREYKNVHPATAVIIATGDPRSRKSIMSKLHTENLDTVLPAVISPQARISNSSAIGPGSIICAGVHISVNVQIDSNCVVNCNSIVGHDVKIMTDTVISAQVSLGGNVTISSGAFVGMGSLVREGVELGAGAFIGMSSSVQSNIPPGVLAMGNPARPIRKVEQVNLYNN